MDRVVIFWRKMCSKLPVILFDTSVIPLAWYLAYWLRHNMQPLSYHYITSRAWIAFSILMGVQIASYYHFKVYRGLWRFSSLNDVARILRAVIFAVMFVVPVFYVFSLFQQVPRSILPLYSIILITLLCGARLIFRAYWDKSARTFNIVEDNNQRVLIIGAGQAGEGLVRDLKRSSFYIPVGFIDDNVNKKGLEVHGVRVLGTSHDLYDIVTRYQIQLIFIAIPSATSYIMRRIVERCEHCNIPFRTLPSLYALAHGHVQLQSLREVKIEDLLGRDQVSLNWDHIATSIQAKRVLITGGGGSIGAELCRQVMRLQPQSLLVLDHSEFNLYKIEQEFRKVYPTLSMQFILVNVTDTVAVQHIFRSFQPQIVFHAAAYKHVPLLEEQVRAAVQNNVLGTCIVAEASVQAHVEKFILISTDKAVNPTNIMGTTKRVAEIYCQNLNMRVATQFITVRFGNVLGSVGSVVPLFQEQLQAGGPLTVTHPDIERYFMTIPEACQLILQAMVNGVGGEIFVLDMGEPIKIRYLAEQMIRLAGKQPGQDIHIEYTGLRPGEKLFEELFHASEQLEHTVHEKIFKANVRQIDWNALTEVIKLLQRGCAEYQHEELLILLKNLVPEFSNNEIPVMQNICYLGD